MVTTKPNRLPKRNDDEPVCLDIFHYESLPSTQGKARELLAQGAGAGTVVVSDEQTQGRGRHGRSWVSPIGGLYASIITPYDILISLRAGIAVVQILDEMAISAQLKWPNDVLVDNKKIAGVLIDRVGDSSIVGIGINLTVTPAEHTTCLERETKNRLSRDTLLNKIISRLIYDNLPGKELCNRYRKLSATIGHRVKIVRRNDEIIGTAIDINNCGHLLIEDNSNMVTITSGDCINMDTFPR